MLWLEADPVRDLEGRTSFSAADASAYQRQQSDLSAVLANIVPGLNLVQPGMPERARNAIRGTQPRFPRQGAPPLPTTTAGNAAVAQIDQAAQSVARGRSLLQTSVASLDAWLQAPTQPSAAADRVNELFQTRDPGYGRLVRDRLQLMLDNLEGRGQLFAHMHRPGDTSTCATTDTFGQTPRPYELYLRIFCECRPQCAGPAVRAGERRHSRAWHPSVRWCGIARRPCTFRRAPHAAHEHRRSTQ